MTETEAIKWMEAFKKTYNGFPKESEEACNIAISALKEVQYYREIGTIVECRQARGKQKANKCVVDTCPDHTHYECPSCGKIQLSVYKHGFPILGRIPKYCENCGQALIDEDWRETEDEH